jgi:hypothetical protein
MVRISPVLAVVSSGSKYGSKHGSKYVLPTTTPDRLEGIPHEPGLKHPVVGGLLTTYYLLTTVTYYRVIRQIYKVLTDNGSKVVTKNTKNNKCSMYIGGIVPIRTHLCFSRFLLTTLLPGVFTPMETRLNWGLQ